MQVFQCDVKGCTYTANSRDYFKHITIKSDVNHELAETLKNKDICPDHALKIFNMIAEQFRPTEPFSEIQKPAKPTVEEKPVKEKKKTEKISAAESDDLSKSMYEDYCINGMSQRDISIKYNKSQAVVSRRIKNYKSAVEAKSVGNLKVDKLVEPAPAKPKNVEVMLATPHAPEPDTLKGFNKASTAKGDKVRQQKCGVVASGSNTTYLAAYIDMHIKQELAATVATRHDIPLDHMLNNFKHDEQRYERIINAIAKMYASGVSVKSLSVKYKLSQDDIALIVKKKVKVEYQRKDVNPESHVYDAGKDAKLDAGGILALFKAGWLIDAIADEKGCEATDVVSVINTIL